MYKHRTVVAKEILYDCEHKATQYFIRRGAFNKITGKFLSKGIRNNVTTRIKNDMYIEY